jgi:KTSC domain-containing protein
MVQLKTIYYPYCEMPPATYDAFLAAPSMGQYYNSNIKGTGKDSPFACRTHAIAAQPQCQARTNAPAMH